MLIKKVYIGSWELAKRTILENFMLKTIVSCPQISDSEKYLYLQIPIVSWMFPKMLQNCWMIDNISTMYSTEFTSSIRHKWLTFLFCYASSYSFYDEHIDQSKKTTREHTNYDTFPCSLLWGFVFLMCLRFWKTTFCLNSCAQKLIFFSKIVF